MLPFLLLLLPAAAASSFINTTVVTVTTARSTLILGERGTLNISLSSTPDVKVVLNLTSSADEIIQLDDGTITIEKGERSVSVGFTAGKRGGTVYVSTKLVSPPLNMSIADLSLAVVHSHSLCTVTDILGWMCFAVWSVSFYPQVYKNWARKSVVGLSFDFLGYNFLGWICYSVFNFSLLWVGEVRREYYRVYPHGVINVQLSDFCFSFHALLITALTIIQCLCYERRGQTPSTMCRLILAGFVSAMLIVLIVAASGCITWLQYVTVFSYVKLAVTLFKYSPQVYMNFRKKSTEAVSIYQFLMDLTGGAISLVQMGIIAYNFDDWKTFIGDFTKFGLAALSISYDLIFIVQHYILYRHSPSLTTSTAAAPADTEPLIAEENSE